MSRARTLVLFAAFFALYAVSIDPRSPNVGWHNFVFDADIDRVMADATGAQNETVFSRHPLFLLVFAWPASLGVALGLPLGSSLCLASALAGALGVVLAERTFLRILGDGTSAVLFAALYGLSSSVWLLSSIPETFALNAVVVAACFAIPHPSFDGGSGSLLRAAGFALLSALAIGVSVSNVLYVALAVAVHVHRSPRPFLGKLLSASVYGGSVTALFVALSLLQKLCFAGRVGAELGLASPFDAAAVDPFLRFSRPFSVADAAAHARAFVLDNVVARRTVIAVVDAVSGPSQMIQMEGASPSSLAATTTLVVLVLSTVLAGTRRSLRAAVSSREGTLALLFLAYNLLFHYFYRANGQPLIFTIHTVLAVLVLTASVFRESSLAYKRHLAGAAALAFAWNGSAFVQSVREALALPCARKVELVCTAWAGQKRDPRLTRGLDAYLASGWYEGELAREALQQGRLEEAARRYRAALRKDPALPWVERDLGLLLAQEGQVGEARPLLLRATERDPDDALARGALEGLRRAH